MTVFLFADYWFPKAHTQEAAVYLAQSPDLYKLLINRNTPPL
jgi:hypothetical protein